MTNVIANIVENRKSYSGKHIERTAEYLRILLNIIFERGLFTKEVMEWDIEDIISSARLHDVGKVAVPDTLLNKPGKLTSEEYEIVKTHVNEGVNIINDIITESGSNEFLYNASIFAGSHHEKWDGSGYPGGLKGSKIPLQGRLLAIVDVYDALVSERPYRGALTHVKAIEIIKENKGVHFDPEITDLFLQNNKLFAEVV